jgi:uncharacterized integral membrane protein
VHCEAVFKCKENMNKRPVPVVIIACLLITAGVFGFAVHFREIVSQKFFHAENLWPLVVALPAVVAGAFVLLGQNWARWLALAWMTFHVAISFFDSWQKVAAHLLLFALIAYCLFRADARAYFCSSTEET